MNEAKFQKKLKRAQAHKQDVERKQQLKELYNYGKQKMETSKKITIYLNILLNVIIIYSLIAMWHFQDLSHLGLLITAIVANVVVFMIYCAKAFFAKKNKELVQLERDRLEQDRTFEADDITMLNENMVL